MLYFIRLLVIRLPGLSDSESRFATNSFGVKVALFWLFELLICNLDQGLDICDVVGKVFPFLLYYHKPSHHSTG